MTTHDKSIASLVRDTDALLREHAATPSHLEQVLSKRLSPTVEKMQQSAATVEKLKLPQGIRGGTIAGIVAGVAAAGGLVYAATRRKKEPASWTARIDAERIEGQTNSRTV